MIIINDKIRKMGKIKLNLKGKATAKWSLKEKTVKESSQKESEFSMNKNRKAD